MRSLNFFGASSGMGKAYSGSGHRPEVLRRETIVTSARILLGAAVIGMAPAMYGLLTGAALPFLLATLILAGAALSLTMARRSMHDLAAMVQSTAIMVSGLVLSVADPLLADPGLGMALMGPILAALLGPGAMRRLSWAGLGMVLLIGLLAGPVGLVGSIAEGQWLPISSVTGFLLAVCVVAYSAHRINAAYEVNDKAQISAYRHLIEHVQDAVLRFASDGSLLMASRSSETLFGCQRFQLHANGIGERLHVLDRPTYLTAFADANQGGRNRTIEVRLRRDDFRADKGMPQFIWVEVQLSPVRDRSENEPRHEVIALMRDVTARKDAERAMAEARQAAEEASLAKSRFLATIGHELRTPLNAVVGFSEMMTSGIGGELSNTHREYAGLIHKSGRHLLEVVGMLLDMSKIEAGRFEIQTDEIDAAEILPACLPMVENLAEARGVSIVSEIEPGLPLLNADERVCRQILLNLLSNAIKFSHDGGQVSVSVRRQGTAINLSVRDRGIGMAPDALKRIGEPFFQVQDGLSRKYEGTGLGLSIVKGLVELHGGTLRAMSEIGAGTTVTVLLPINGPATKPGDTADIHHLHSEPTTAAPVTWPNEKRKAQ